MTEDFQEEKNAELPSANSVTGAFNESDCYIANLHTKQTISLAGEIAVKWRGNTIEIAGCNLYKILSEYGNSLPMVSVGKLS